MSEANPLAQIYRDFKELSEQIGIPVREEATENMRCGLFVLKGKEQIFINRADSFADRVDVMVNALRKKDLSAIFVKPVLRELLEKG
ncbi:MAG: hypothetical protein JNL74_10270 [Fibrobacteres bacterium]|nr:hypothetical protein [Fibrobacterota bacterium]